MAPKRDPRKAGPAPVPDSFLGATSKRTSAASAAKAAGAPKPGTTRPRTGTRDEVRADKRQRNSSGAAASDSKKLKGKQGFDPKGEAAPLGARRKERESSPTTSVSTVVSESTDCGTVEDKEVGDELQEIKQYIKDLHVEPQAKVCTSNLN
jgi:hypothetical protein